MQEVEQKYSNFLEAFYNHMKYADFNILQTKD